MSLSGGKGNSRANTSSASSTTTNTTNNVDNRVTTSDFGAIKAALSFAGDTVNSSLDSADAANRRALEFGETAINAVGDAVGDTASFVDGVVGRAFDSNKYVQSRAFDQNELSLNTIADLNSNSLDLLGSLVGQTIDATKTLAREGAQANSDTLADALGGFKQLAIQNSETSDDKITRIIGYALAAVAAVVVLPMVFKGGGAKTVIA